MHKTFALLFIVVLVLTACIGPENEPSETEAAEQSEEVQMEEIMEMEEGMEPAR